LVVRRTLTLNERIAIVAARKLEEEKRHPGKFVYVYVADQTNRKGEPRVRVVIKNKPWFQAARP
jgi:hypothetical protein